METKETQFFSAATIVESNSFGEENQISKVEHPEVYYG